MHTLHMLWLPILVSAIFVFLVSSVIHMLSPWHKNDYPRVPDEEGLRKALRPLNIPPGDYMVPRATSRQEMSSPEFLEKMKEGPVVIMTVVPNGAMALGTSLGLWFLYSLAIGVMAANVARHSVAPGAPWRHIFHFVALPSFMGYAVALWQMSIWYRRSWIITVKATVDGLIYAVLTAATFVWLWPR